jgi:drug/metabolite transporter (DMT)-like permease
MTAGDDAPLRPIDWVSLAAPGLIWGSSFFLIAEGLESFHPAFVGWLRILFGLTVLSAFPVARRPVARAARPRLVALAFVWMGAPLTLFAFAQERIASSLAGMLNTLNPVLTVVVGFVVFRRRASVGRVLGVVLGTLGGALIALPSLGEGSSSAIGLITAFAALCCYGFALNIAGPLQQEVGAIPVVHRALAGAAVMAAPTGLWGLSQSSFSWSSLAAIAVLGAVGTGLAYVWMAWNAGRLGGTRASTTNYVIPVVSIILGVGVRGETVAAMALAGTVVTILGAWQVNRSP